MAGGRTNPEAHLTKPCRDDIGVAQIFERRRHFVGFAGYFQVVRAQGRFNANLSASAAPRRAFGKSRVKGGGAFASDDEIPLGFIAPT